MSYHHRFWVIFVLLQESGHGKDNGAARCHSVRRLGIKESLKDVLITREPDFDMLTCGDDLYGHELVIHQRQPCDTGQTLLRTAT